MVATVLILCLSDLWLPFPGGAERLMFNLARDLCRRGLPVVAVTGDERSQRYDGAPVRGLPIGIGAEHAEGWALLEPELVGAKVVLTHHLYAREFERELIDSGIPIVQVVLNGARIAGIAFAVYISEHVRERAGGGEPEDLVLTPPAFDDVVADSHGDAIGFIKPIPHKGVDLVYELAESLPDRRFVILRGEWQTLEVIRDLSNVEFMEPVEDIRDFYRECRLLLMPSVSEDAGTVAQEAALNGLPCVSSGAGGLPETNGGGMRLDTRNPAAWVRVIEDLDDEQTYAFVAARQRAYLSGLGHEGRLAELAGRIEALWIR